MKVLFINSVCGFGSTGKIVVDLYNFCNNKGAQSLICYGRKNNNLKNINSIKISNSFLTLINVLFARIFDNEGLNSHISTIKLIKIIEKNKPDIIHLNNIHGYYLNFKMLFNYLKKCETPIVWTLHDCWAFTGHCSHYISIKCEKWKIQCHNCPLKNSYPKALIFDNSKKMYKLKKEKFSNFSNLTLVTPSFWLKNQVELSFFKCSPIVINNGVDINKFKIINTVKEEKNKIIILAVSNIWTYKKGFYDVLELDQLLTLNKISNVEIILIGQCSNLKIKKSNYKNIIFYDRTENVEKLVEFYNKADIFFNPSYEDTFPTVIIESLCCGTPVIAYNTSGVKEMINIQNGILLEKGNLHEFLSKFMDMVKLKKSNSENISREAHQKYDKNLALKKYYSLFKKIVDKEINI